MRARRGQLLTGCVTVDGIDKCFANALDDGATPCAKSAGGYNLTTLQRLLDAGKGADGLQGSPCNPKVCAHALVPPHCVACSGAASRTVLKA